MVYTEIKERDGKRYYYRVKSMRIGSKFRKKRIYIGKNLPKKELSAKEKLADTQLVSGESKVLRTITRKIKGILRKNHVARAGVFGSYARGEQRQDSDIDLAVEIADKKMSLVGFIRLIGLLEGALGKKVDLVEYSAIKPRLKKMILEEEVRII